MSGALTFAQVTPQNQPTGSIVGYGPDVQLVNDSISLKVGSSIRILFNVAVGRTDPIYMAVASEGVQLVYPAQVVNTNKIPLPAGFRVNLPGGTILYPPSHRFVVPAIITVTNASPGTYSLEVIAFQLSPQGGVTGEDGAIKSFSVVVTA